MLNVSPVTLNKILRRSTITLTTATRITKYTNNNNTKHCCSICNSNNNNKLNPGGRSVTTKHFVADSLLEYNVCIAVAVLLKQRKSKASASTAASTAALAA